ncbi:dATP/dGTP pyrophosphohydrolase domain-containing protein, partial [Raoultella ornithinolytica]|uniref:dATP/dGTP pyrophosphohydrolase domain-containing protein n=1 Tax=Raoultella ornithinolytica TaxID=54291 RepID=UPI00403DDBA4
MEHNSRCVRGSVEVDARLFESMIMELQERRKAAMDSEPVAVVDIQRGRGDGRKYALCYTSAGHSLPDDVYNLYVVRQPAPERDRVRCEHAEWSQATFGNVGPVGPLKHLSKEALEAAAEPGDLSEWADMQFLLWDAQRRAGITDEQITKAMIEKLAVNKQREWPEPKDGEPRLHIKEQLAPVVPTFEEWCKRTEQKPQGWVRDAMKEAYDGAAVAMLQAGNSPVIPEGYVMVPKEPTQAMCAAFNDSDYGRKSLRERYVAMLA